MSDKVNWEDFTPTGQPTPAASTPVDWSQFTPAKPSGALRRGVADKAIGFASGAVGATKALADVAGAGNVVSNTLEDVNKGISDYLSPEAKADQQEQSAIMAGATGKGVLEGVKAGFKAFGVAPVQTAVQGLGSIAPIIAGTALTGGVVPTAAAGAAIGVGMGAGTAKGAIFDEVKKRAIAKGSNEADATAEADAAQSYGGDNTDQIALGGALGAADALTGVSAIATRMARGALRKPVTEAITNTAERGVMARAGMGMLKEMPLEAAQGGQEQVAANLAAQRAGYEAGTWDNVASNATLEALASAGPGAAFGALDTGAKPAPVVPPSETTATPDAVAPPAAEPAAPLQIGMKPDPYLSFADGTVARRSEMDAYINALPEDQQAAMRTKLMGLEPQTVPPEFAKILDTDTTYEGWSNVRDGTDRVIMRDQMDYVQKTYSPIATEAKREEITADLNQQFKWFRSAKPSEQIAAIDALIAAPKQPKPSEAMGLNPAAGPMSAAAVTAVDAGVTQELQLADAAQADQAAYEQATTAQAEQQAAQDTVDKPITAGTLAEAAMSEEDKRAVLFSNKSVSDGGIQYEGTQDGDILNGMGAPFSTKLGAQRRVRMEGSDYTIATVFDGFVARRKDAMPAKTNTPTASVGGNFTTQAETEKQPNEAPAPESTASAATENVAGGNVLDLTKRLDERTKDAAMEKAVRQELDSQLAELVALEKQKRVTYGDLAELENITYSNDNGYNASRQLHALLKTIKQRPSADIDSAGQSVIRTQDAAANDSEPAPVTQPAQPVMGEGAGGSQPTQVAADIKAITAKQIPDMSDAEIAQAVAHYGPDHARTAKLTKEANKRALVAKLKGKSPQSTESTNGTQAPETVQAAQEGSKAPDPAVDQGDGINDNIRALRAKSFKSVKLGGPRGDVRLSTSGEYVSFDDAVAEARKAVAGGVRAVPFQIHSALDVNIGDTDRIIAALSAPVAKPVTPQIAPAAPASNMQTADAPVRPSAEASNSWNEALEKYALGNYHDLSPERRVAFGEGYTRAFDGLGLRSGAKHIAEQVDGAQFYERTSTDKKQGEPVKADEKQPHEMSFSEFRKQRKGNPHFDEKGFADDGEYLRAAQATYDALVKKAAAAAPIANVVQAAKDSGKLQIINVADKPTGPRVVVNKLGADGLTDAERAAGKPSYADAPAAKAKPAAKTPSADELRAKADLMNALADLGSILNAPFKANITPEQQQKLMPVLTRVLDAAFRLGYSKFKDAAKFALDQITSALGREAADSLTLKHLQGSYIAMSSDKMTADEVDAVVAVKSKAEIEQHNAQTDVEKSGDQADTGTKETNDDPRTEKQGDSALDGVPAPKVGGSGSGGSGGRGTGSGSTGRRKGNSSTDGQRGATGRSGGNSAADSDSAATGGSAGGRGIKGDGGRIPADGGAPNVSVPAGSGRGVPEGKSGLLTAAGEVVPAAVPAANFTITPDLKLGSGGEVTKYKDNIAAIRALKLIESEHRRATAEEQRVLARYVGWGGLANAFRNRVTGAVKADWTNEVTELESLLTAKELKAASASTPNAHYTSETVTGFMWRAAQRLGFNGGMVLEPSVGSGNFIGLMPASARKGSYVTAIELDGITARIASALYPQSNIIASGFEKLPLPEAMFDLAIGNPPFGQVQLRFQYNPKLNGKSIHNQFFLGSMEAVKPEGLQVMVVSRYLMDAQEKGAREALAIQAELVSAIRLPGSAFKGNAGTDVVTDILFLKKRTTAEQVALQYAFDERTSKVPAKEPYADTQARLGRAAKLNAALAWTGTTSVPDPLGGEPMVISQYFAKNPKMVAGVMDRSGSMQFGGDIDVKLPASELAAKLDAMMEFLPSMEPVSVSEEIDQRTQAMHKALGDSLSIMASGREIGSIYYDESGALTEIVERVGEDGKTIVSKNVVNASTPWSSQLSMNMEGQWFKEVAQLNDKGEKVKKGVKLNLKTGKPTAGRNVWVREVFAKESDVPAGLRLGAEGFAKLQKLVAIRELYVEQINLESNAAATGPMEANRGKLRAAYESFVAEHGYISEQKNAGIISEMPDEGLMLSLELKFRPAVTLAAAVKRGIKPSAARAEQNAILTRAVAIPPERKDNAGSISDAVAIVLGEAGRIDVARVAELRKVTEEEALAELTEGDSPMAYLDPETNEVTEKNQYLSGNVRKKLIAAQDTGMKRNIEALMKVQPEAWSSDKVTAHMGASWVPPEVYAEFVKGLLGRDANVTFSKISNTFEVFAPGNTAVDTSKWGTGRLPAVALINDILNSRRIAIYDGGGKDDPRVLNETETQSAIDKKKEIVEEFDNWIFKDGNRRQELVKLFNDLYNTRVNRQYDGSHMEFPGKVPDSIIAFRRNQINAIWRGIVERFTMYDHAVGAGKTFTGISRAMERKRMGLSNKPTIVVPNHLVSEWSTQAYRLYPGAKILAAGAKDLEPKNRRRLFAKIAAGDWDLVIVPHSSFKFIGISPETEERFISDELRVAQDALKEAEEDAEPGQRFAPLSVKAAEALIKKLENRMDVVRGKSGKDQLLTFEQMGIDDLTVDESHEFKNLTYSTKLTDVRGLGPAAGSQKAFDLYTKMRILHETNGSAVFLTGTPISNSAVEMYTIMRYLAPDVLKENGLEHFDAFRAQYVQASEKPEPTEAGDGLKVVNRLGRNWSNMRSLMDGYYSVADVVTNDDIKTWYAEDNPGKVFPLPNVKGGARRSVVAKPTPTQQRLIDELIAGYNGLPNIEDVRERNSARLRLMDKARKLALHAKAWDRSLTDEPGGKLDKVVDESFRLYNSFAANKGTQLIFLDRSVPKAQGDDKQIKEYDALRAKLADSTANNDENGQREAIEALEKFDQQEIDELRAAQNGGWNAYQHMADGLIAKGVPKEQIAFIQNFTTDAQKKALFEAVNDGSIRFLFGSSQRMGAGMNVQERLVGLHHVDVTWKPSDIEQREGRIIRQGNLFFTEMVDGKPNPMYDPKFEVEVMAYVTERSIDAKMWDLNSTKLRMVNGIRYYDGEFEMDFDDDAAIDMAEIAAIASGDPLMLERIKVNTVIEEMYRKRKSYNRRIESAGDSLRRAEDDVETLPSRITKAKALMVPTVKAVQDAEDDKSTRRVKVGGQEFRGMESALKHAEEAIKIAKEGDSKRPFSLDVDGESYTSEAGVMDAIAEKMGDVSAFVAEIAGKKVIRRTAVARELRRLIGNEFTDMPKKAVGSLFGFPLFASTESSKYGSFVSLTAEVAYEGGVEMFSIGYDLTPDKHKKGTAVPVLTSSLRAAVEELVNKLSSTGYRTYAIESMERSLEDAKVNIPTYREAAKEQFKQADELDAALTRLDDIQEQLQARAAAAAAAPTTPAADADTVAFSRAKNRPTFSRGAQAQANQSVQKLVDALRSNWDNAPEIIVAFDMQDANIPEAVRQEDLKQRSGGAQGTPEGFYYKGKVYLLSSQLATPNDVARVLFHETLGHFGLRSHFGKGLKPILNQIITFRKALVDAKIKEYGLRSVNNLDRLAAAEEVLAEMAQTKPEIGFVKRAIAIIRSWLRANVPGFNNMKMTDAEIITNFILPARRFVEGKGGPNGGMKAPASVNIDTQPAFSRSLGATLTDAANNVRGVNLPAGYQVGDLFNSAPGKLNWWHRTVGTQYNLAQRSKPFKRVYDAVQNFMNDVSYFATEAADLAPSILPKLESWKDITKSPMSPADTQALSAPVFEGTLVWGRDESGKLVKMETLEAAAAKLTTDQKSQRLLRGNHLTAGVLKMWRGLPIDQYEALIEGKYERDMLKAGVVFTDAELKSQFNLTDAQIGLYREFRAATDKSLTNLSTSDMLRFAGKDADPIRDAVLSSKTPSEAADTLAEYLRSLAATDPERSDVLMDTADKIILKGDKTKDLIDRGYAPLSRFGKYTLDVVDAGGDRVYFGMFESQAEAAKMTRKMQGLYPDATISRGTVSEEAYKLFAGVSPETLELFGDMIALEAQGDGAANAAFQEYLKLAKSSRSAMKRLIQRKGIAGFSEDAGRVLAGFVYSNARQTSSALHMGEMTQAASDKDAFKNQGELQDAAVKLVDYIKNPQEEAQALRGLLFAQYIGGSIASAMVNMTQPLTMTLPWLAQFGGITNAAKNMASAVKDANKKLTGDAKLDAALKRAEEDGTVSPQEVHQLMKQSMGSSALKSGDGTMAGNALAAASNNLSRVMLAWGKPFSLAEQFNRRSTFIAAYRTAVAQKMADPDAFARRAIAETQGVYNKGNKPAWARGAVGSVLFTFKQYSISYVEMLSRMSKNGPEGKKAALLALGILFLMAGAGGMPGADDLDDVINMAMQGMGYNFDSKQKRQAFFVELLGEGGAQFMERGISGLPGVPIDVSGRMGLGNLIPATGLLVKKPDHTRDIAELIGPAGDLIKRGYDASGKLLTGNVFGANGAMSTIAPKAAQNLYKAYDMQAMGMYRDDKGMKVLDTDGTDAVMKAIGFQPIDVKRSQDANFDVTRMIGLNKMTESEIAGRWALGLFEKDADKVQAARDDLEEWNRANPESPIRINFVQIRNRVKKMNETKSERIAKTAPIEIRNAVREELAAGR